MIDFRVAPLWLIFVISLALILLANEVGRSVRRRAYAQHDDNVSSLEGAVLGLLALMIGFSFAMSLSHFDSRRSAVLDEANAIGTVALRARLLPTPHNSESLDLLREYTRLRLDAATTVRTVADLDTFVDRSNALQEALWQQARAAMAKNAAMVPTGLFIQSLNDMIDHQEKRVTAVRAQLPAMVLIALYGVALVAATLMGYARGLAPRRTYLPNLAVSVLVAAVILFVQDIDRPEAGFIKIDQQPMIDTARSLAGYRD